MAESGEDFQGAVRDYVIQQLSGCSDRGLRLDAENDMYLGLRVPKIRLYAFSKIGLVKQLTVFGDTDLLVLYVRLYHYLNDIGLGRDMQKNSHHSVRMMTAVV